jgi:hypothetical protein
MQRYYCLTINIYGESFTYHNHHEENQTVNINVTDPKMIQKSIGDFKISHIICLSYCFAIHMKNTTWRNKSQMNNKMLHGPDITEKIVYDYMTCSPIKEQLL